MAQYEISVCYGGRGEYLRSYPYKEGVYFTNLKEAEEKLVQRMKSNIFMGISDFDKKGVWGEIRDMSQKYHPVVVRVSKGKIRRMKKESSVPFVRE